MELEVEAEGVFVERASGFGVEGGDEGDGGVRGEGHGECFLDYPIREWAARTHHCGGVVIM